MHHGNIYCRRVHLSFTISGETINRTEKLCLPQVIGSLNYFIWGLQWFANNRYKCFGWFLLICYDTLWTIKGMRLSFHLKHIKQIRAGVTVSSTVLTTVHDEVVSRVKLGKTGITAKTMFHVLVFYFILNKSSLLTHTALGWNTIRTYGNKWFSFLIWWKARLAAKIFTCGSIFQLDTDHIL